MRRPLWQSIVLLSLLAPARAPAATAADAKSNAAARDHSISVINEAVKTLTSEYEAHQKDPNAALREKADYFTEHPAPDLAGDMVLDTISRNFDSISETCYVRWQLLSFFNPTEDHDQLMKVAQQIGMLYSRAPAPLPNPSLIPAIRSALDREASHERSDDVNHLNDLWNQKVAGWVSDNLPIRSYNDALYALLPDSFGKFKLGWSDLFDKRVPAGLPVIEQYQKMYAALGIWDVTAAPGDRRILAQMIAHTSDRMSTTYPPTLYGQAVVDDKTSRVQFVPAPAAVPPKKSLDDLAKAVLAGTAPPSTAPPSIAPPAKK